MGKFKLIHIDKDLKLVCDNPTCGFESKNRIPFDLTNQFVNTSCPRCGLNLLTPADYKDWIALHKTIDFINKWLGWLIIFIPAKKQGNTKQIKVHHGIHITDEKENN